jgi:hypothetical protein
MLQDKREDVTVNIMKLQCLLFAAQFFPNAANIAGMKLYFLKRLNSTLTVLEKLRI